MNGMKEAKGMSSGQLLLGMGVGALLMYIVDPQHGARRRARARDQMVQLGRSGSELIETGADQLRQGADHLNRLNHLRHLSQLSHLGHRTDGMVGKARGHVPSVLVGAAGLGLAMLAMNRRGTGRATGGMFQGRPIQVEKTIHIDAAPEHLFDLWSNYDNFPRFMSMVEEVRPLDGDRSHWVVKGPAGTRLEWDSVITERQRGRVLAWRSEPGSGVEHSGRVEFHAAPRGTQATVTMSYRPPGGVLGHAVASLFGRNPKQDLDADLARMKSFVESGQSAGAGVQAVPQGNSRPPVTVT